MNLYHGKRLGWAYRRGLVDRDGNNTWIGHTATVLLFVLLGTAFFWVPVVLSAIAVAALLAGPAAFIFCLIAAPIGFAMQRRNRAHGRD